MYRIRYQRWNDWLRLWVIETFSIPAEVIETQRRYYQRQARQGRIRNLSITIAYAIDTP